MSQLTRPPVGVPMLSIRQAMEIVGVSRRTIYTWINTGKVDYARTPGRRIRIVEASLWKGRTLAREASEHLTAAI